MNEFLLKYDNNHIRAYYKDKDFIQFSHFEDRLLPLVKVLFVTSASICLTTRQIDLCYYLIDKNTADYQLILDYQQSLHISLSSSNLQYDYEMDQIRCQYWQDIFNNDADNFSLYNVLGLQSQGKSNLYKFLKEIKFPIPKYPCKMKILYKNRYFFIPIEFSSLFFVVHVIEDEYNYKNTDLKNVSIMYDPDLQFAYEDSLNILKIIEKCNLSLNMSNPDILLISAHGIIDKESHLENKELELLIESQTPKITIFNSCLLGRKYKGIISDFIQKESMIIASPYYILANKTIFPPMLRFLYDLDCIYYTFQIMKIFYPNIGKYFRLFIKNKL